MKEESQSKSKKDLFVKGLNWGDLKTTEEDIINIDTNTSTDDTTKENTNGSTD